ncbi:peptide ABC transporter [Acuticoccus sediminis]|uniref:Peptide ABC transporter n=1 Tax=Acuticoccus sediminis TaxID=2184697 RepID=A0A8B2NPN9_9HYPH|nr:ABC transporter permease [Acuticoccus sediminis]RAI01855.1 peptide ABC transporter [Acuticoccus sediminis]
MLRYTIRRLIGALPTLLLASMLVFLMSHLAPGDPASQILGSYATPAELEQARQEMGLNDPLPVQYVRWLAKAATGDLGTSINWNMPVSDMILERLPRTAGLAVLALAFSILMGVPLGILAGVKQNRPADRAAMVASLLGLSVPDFVVGLLLVIVFTVNLGLLPSVGYVDFGTDPAQWAMHLIMPAFALGYLMTAVTARMTRASMIENLGQEFVLSARAKGLTETRVVGLHVLKAALIPVVTVVGINLGSVFRGAVVIESIFAIPGIGGLMIGAIDARDYPVIQGCLLASVTIYIGINLVVDLTYALLDPRIRYK